MRTILPAIIALLALISFIFFVDKERTVVYDCRLAEISPDFPPEVREECRRLRYEHWKQQQKNMI